MFWFGRKRDPAEYLRGSFEHELRGSVRDLLLHFSSLPGWADWTVPRDELAALAAFLAMQTLRDHIGRARLSDVEVTQIGVTLACGLSRLGVDPQEWEGPHVKELQDAAVERLTEYDAIFTGALEAQDMGSFHIHVYGSMKGESEISQEGVLDHFAKFPQVCLLIERSLASAI